LRRVAWREMIVSYDYPEVGPARLPGNPIKISSMEGTISRPASRVGEPTDKVLGALLGLSAERVAGLREEGAVT
jgi:crotonobetainyl-CoA:carnitine CoA-transferase CaiB-like acyl-CoA transferase